MNVACVSNTRLSLARATRRSRSCERSAFRRIDVAAESQIAALLPCPCPHVQRWPFARSARRCVRSRSRIAVTSTSRFRNDALLCRIIRYVRSARGTTRGRIFRNGEQNDEQRREQVIHIFLQRLRRVAVLYSCFSLHPPRSRRAGGKKCEISVGRAATFCVVDRDEDRREERGRGYWRGGRVRRGISLELSLRVCSLQ